jgi:hypothetical protein
MNQFGAEKKVEYFGESANSGFSHFCPLLFALRHVFEKV